MFLLQAARESGSIIAIGAFLALLAAAIWFYDHNIGATIWCGIACVLTGYVACATIVHGSRDTELGFSGAMILAAFTTCIAASVRHQLEGQEALASRGRDHDHVVPGVSRDERELRALLRAGIPPHDERRAIRTARTARVLAHPGGLPRLRPGSRYIRRTPQARGGDVPADHSTLRCRDPRGGALSAGFILP